MGVRKFLDQPLGAQFGEFIAEGSQFISGGGASQRGGDLRVEFAGGEGSCRRQVREADQGMHQRQLAGMIELESRDPPSAGAESGLAELAKLAAVHAGLQDVLLGVQITVDDGSGSTSQLRQILDGFVDAVIQDIVGGWLGAQEAPVADILFDKAVLVMGADHGVTQVPIFDHGLQLAPIGFGDAPPEDQGKRVGLAQVAVGIQQTLPETIQGRAAFEDEVVAVLDLSKEEAMLDASLASLAGGKERQKTSQPFLGAAEDVLGLKRIR